MTPEQIAFIARRRRQIRAWPWLAAVLVILLAGAYAWLWKVAPHNLDPGAILDEYHMRHLADQELIMLAARGSVALIACGLAVLVLVVMVSLALWNEHRLIRMLEDATAGAANGPQAPDAGAVAGAPDPAAVADGEPGAADSAAGGEAASPASSGPGPGTTADTAPKTP